MAVESYDFTDFVERDGLISYKDLFAAEASGLKGKMKVCDELQAMDRKEYEVLCIEQSQLDSLRKGFLLSAFLFIAISVSGMVLSLLHGGFFFLGAIVAGI